MQDSLAQVHELGSVETVVLVDCFQLKAHQTMVAAVEKNQLAHQTMVVV